MGIPFSKEITRAFEELDKAYGQITPLVAAAYEVLETTKNISLLVAAIQVLTVTLLALILLALVGLLITMNPDLEQERRELVTPVLKWLTMWTSVVKLSSVFAFAMMTAIITVMIMVNKGIGPFAERWKGPPRDMENDTENIEKQTSAKGD